MVFKMVATGGRFVKKCALRQGMRRGFDFTMTFLLAALAVYGQQTEPPRFEVASIKPGGDVFGQLTETLWRVSHAPVRDRTGTSGKYYFAFRYASDLDADSNIEAPALASALRDAMGLKLQKSKGVVETLVIDSIEEPSAN